MPSKKNKWISVGRAPILLWAEISYLALIKFLTAARGLTPCLRYFHLRRGSESYGGSWNLTTVISKEKREILRR